MIKERPPTWNHKRKQLDVISQFKDFTDSATSEEDVLHGFCDHCNLQDSNILEVGGSIHPDWLKGKNIKSWTAVDIYFPNTIKSNNYTYLNADIIKTDLQPCYFDYVFSCNAVHHISPLQTFFERIFECLKPLGIAYLHFGPIWSAPDGHHLDIKYKGIVFRFDGINIIPNWSHLLWSPEEMRAALIENFAEEFAIEVVDYIYFSNFMNRNFFEDYIEFAANAGFSFLHFSSSNHLDYEYHEPETGRLEYPSAQGLLSAIKIKVGEKRENFWARDLLMVLIKPPV